mmetsp:Transcript_10928/g.16672  ORF Transcript_10928/g.16672 Transcript_10928/m.16672 type:complete len:145 (-) Transcript_10928:1114-1548(-)
MSSSSAVSSLFDIKIAFLGHVSAGKSTLINALLGQEFTEVSMKRTMAGVNHFVLASVDQQQHDQVLSSRETLIEIKRDNCKLRNNTKAVKEKMFFVELAKLLFTLRKDAHIILSDIPGLNEAGSFQVYSDFVKMDSMLLSWSWM